MGLSCDPSFCYFAQQTQSLKLIGLLFGRVVDPAFRYNWCREVCRILKQASRNEEKPLSRRNSHYCDLDGFHGRNFISFYGKQAMSLVWLLVFRIIWEFRSPPFELSPP